MVLHANLDPKVEVGDYFTSDQLFNKTFQANPPTYVKVDYFFLHEQRHEVSGDIAVLIINNDHDPEKLSKIYSLWPALLQSDLPQLGYLD